MLWWHIELCDCEGVHRVVLCVRYLTYKIISNNETMRFDVSCDNYETLTNLFEKIFLSFNRSLKSTQCWHFLSLRRKPWKWRLTWNLIEKHILLLVIPTSDCMDEVFVLAKFSGLIIPVILLAVHVTLLKVRSLQFCKIKWSVWRLSLSLKFKLEPTVVDDLNVIISVHKLCTCTYSTSTSRRPKTLDWEFKTEKNVYTHPRHLLSDSLCSLSPPSCWQLVPSRLDREMTVHHQQQVSDRQVLALITLSHACDLCHTTTDSPGSAWILRNMENFLLKATIKCCPREPGW